MTRAQYIVGLWLYYGVRPIWIDGERSGKKKENEKTEVS